MPTYDLDEESTLFEPLKIKLGGIELTIKDVARKEFDKIANITDPYEQLAQWAGEKLEVIDKIPMKKVSAALKIIGKEILDAGKDFPTAKKA